MSEFETIDHYRLVKPLGSGASSEVFLAVDVRSNKLVSLKILGASRRQESHARFKRAAELWKTLKHDNIALFLDHGHTERGDPYIVLEFIEGHGLDEIIARDAPIEPDRARKLFRQLMVALRVAHKKGVIHRDIKPSNLLITLSPASNPRFPARERIKLIDFGLARVVDKTDGRARAGSPAGITAAGHIVGTPRYIAPEQVTPEGACLASDVYSAALVYYEMLTGEPAVPDKSISDVLYKHLTPNPTIAPDDPALPHTLARILSKATARQPDDRFSSIEAFLAALDKVNLSADDTASGDIPIPEDLAVEDTADPIPPTILASLPDHQPLELLDLPDLPMPSDTNNPGLPRLENHNRAPLPGIQQPIQIPEDAAAHIPNAGERPQGEEDAPVELGTTVSWGRRMLRIFMLLILFYSVSVGGFWILQDLVLFRTHSVQVKNDRKLAGGKMAWDKVSITSSNEKPLVAYFGEARRGRRLGTLLYLHGLDSQPEIDAVYLDKLRDRGLHVLVFGQQGYAGSKGYSDADSFHDDALKAYDWIIGTRGAKPFKVFALGRGVGAAVALHLSQERPIKAIIVEGASPSLAGRMTDIVPIVPFELLLHRDFDLRPITRTKRPVLFLYGKKDLIAPPSDVKGLYNRIKAPKSFQTIKNVGHNELGKKSGGSYRKAIHGFIVAFGD